MTNPLELTVGHYLDALSDPDDPIASGVLAAQVVAGAAALLAMAARASATPGASSITAQAETIRERCEVLVMNCARAFGEATERLRRRAETEGAGEQRDWLLGRALRRAAEGPAAVAEAAGDVGILAEVVAEVCAPEQLPDVQAAVILAEGAARTSLQLVAVNLVAGADEQLLATARNGVGLVTEARSKLAGGS